MGKPSNSRRLRGWYATPHQVWSPDFFPKNDPLLRHVFLWCLHRVNNNKHTIEIKGATVHLEKDQFLCSRDKAGEELGLSPSTFRNKMEKLEKLGKIKMKALRRSEGAGQAPGGKADNLGTLVTVLERLDFRDTPFLGQASRPKEDTDNRETKDSYKTNKSKYNNPRAYLGSLNPEEREVVESWNCVADMAGFEKITVLSLDQKRSLKNRLKDNWWNSNWKWGIEKLSLNPGREYSVRKLTFDWFISPRGLKEILDTEKKGVYR